MSLSKGDIALNELENLMSTERYKKAINAYLKWQSDNLDYNYINIQLLKYLIKTDPYNKIIQQCDPEEAFKMFEQLAKKRKYRKRVDNYIINREAEIILLKSLKLLGDQMGKLKTDFLYIPKNEREKVPYVIDFEIAIGEDEERKKEELKNNFLKNIKPVFKLYINQKVDENPNFDVNGEVKSFSFALGSALNNEMIYGKDLNVFNTDSKLKNYINEIETDKLKELLYKDLVGATADTIMIAKQCFNILSERYNKELNNNDNMIRNNDIDCHDEKLKNLNDTHCCRFFRRPQASGHANKLKKLNKTLSELKNIILKKYGDYSASFEERKSLACFNKGFFIKIHTDPEDPYFYEKNFYYIEINKKYLENGGIDEIPTEEDNKENNI